MRSQDRKVPAEQLTLAIENVLRTGPHSIDELSRELGYSVSAVRSRLDVLVYEQRVHRRKVTFKSWTGVGYFWHYGAAPDIPVAEVVPQATVPFQSTVQTYPAINRRDPLVAALFGPTRQAIKRGH